MTGIGDIAVAAAGAIGGAVLGWLITEHASARPIAGHALPVGWIGFHASALAPLELRNARASKLTYRPVGASGEPYPEWVQALRGKSGVYVIRDARSGEVLYVGESHSDKLHETLTRHLQQWHRWTKRSWWPGQFVESDHDPGLTYKRHQVEIAVRTLHHNNAIDEERRLIAALRPRDNLRGQPPPKPKPKPRPELEPAPF